MSLFFKEQREQFAHVAIRSRSLFFKKRFAHGRYIFLRDESESLKLAL